jgi:hypothetical protein
MLGRREYNNKTTRIFDKIIDNNYDDHGHIKIYLKFFIDLLSYGKNIEYVGENSNGPSFKERILAEIIIGAVDDDSTLLNAFVEKLGYSTLRSDYILRRFRENQSGLTGIFIRNFGEYRMATND